VTVEETRAAIVRETTSWVGTRYHDHAGIKHVGVDCAYLPLRVYQAVGRIPSDFQVPYYSPQQWLNSPSQKDKFHLRFEDKTYLNIVLRFAKQELKENQVQSGDFVLYKVAASWTHGAIIIHWPEYILHPIIGRGVIGSHGTREGFLVGRPRRYFSVFTKEEEEEGRVA
jgi:cell wall-associated NlpC family hydrolase